MKRREFLRTSALGTLAMSLPLSRWQVFAQETNLPHAAFVTNGEPEPLVKNALQALGGMERFIQKGDKVLLKPNIGWDRSPELAANTNPEIVATLTTLCFAAGASEVKVLDRTCNDPQRCYRNSGIADAAEARGAEIVQVRKSRYEEMSLNGKALESWPIYKDYLEADKVINIPIAKHHGMAKVSLGLKNLMGVMGGRRGRLHVNFAEKMADITQHIMPTLTVIDAYRMLMANGPSGGNPDDVRLVRSLIASPCTVSADVLGLELFGHSLADIEQIQVAVDRGLALYDTTKLNVARIDLS